MWQWHIPFPWFPVPNSWLFIAPAGVAEGTNRSHGHRWSDPIGDRIHHQNPIVVDELPQFYQFRIYIYNIICVLVKKTVSIDFKGTFCQNVTGIGGHRWLGRKFPVILFSIHAPKKKASLCPFPSGSCSVDCGRPAAAQSCYETVGCTWQKGPGTETAWVMEAVISDSQFQRCCVRFLTFGFRCFFFIPG